MQMIYLADDGILNDVANSFAQQTYIFYTATWLYRPNEKIVRNGVQGHIKSGWFNGRMPPHPTFTAKRVI